MGQSEMEEMAMKCFQIISAVGTARTCFVEAMELARHGDFDGADKKLEEGSQRMVEGHTEHTCLVQQEASGKHVEPSLFLVHAEDQLMSAETCKIMAYELILVYRELKGGLGGGTA